MKAVELICTLPLIAVGILGLLNPLIVIAAVVLALIPWIIRFSVDDKLTRHTFVTGALLLLTISAFISMWGTYDITMSGPMLFTLLGSINLFFAIANTTFSARHIARGLVIVAGLVALYFVGQYAHFNYHTETGQLARLGRMTGSLLPNIVFFVPHPNAVAGFLAGTLLLSLALTWQENSLKRLIWALITVVIAYGLLITQSRGAWVGLAVAISIWVLLLIPNPTARLLVAGLGVAAILLGGYAVLRLPLTTQQIPLLASASETAGSRFALYRNSAYLLGDYLFTGIGLGDVFGMVYSRYQLLIRVPYLTYSHNIFLSIGLGLGLLGLIGFVWLLISFYYFVIRVESAGLHPRRLPLFRAGWLGITATFGHGLTDAPQFSAPGWTMPMLFALLGLAIIIGRSSVMRHRRSRSRRRAGGWYQPWKRVAMAAVAIVLLAVAIIFWRPLAGAWYANMGALYQTQADLSPDLIESERQTAETQAVAYFEQALNLYPSYPVANRRYGLLVLNRQVFDEAVIYLARAYKQEPQNQATLKALGLAYLWTGQPDLSATLLKQLDDQGELVEELRNWRHWWTTQNQEELVIYADEMILQLSEAGSE